MWARSSRSRSRRRSSHVPQALLSRMNSAKWFLILSIAAILAWGCAHSSEEDSIAPLAPASGRVDPGLGPGAQALSSGPGYKSSPRWSPEGDRIAFTVDGYVVDTPTGSEGLRRWTTRDFFAEDTEWESDDALMILGAAPSAGAQEISSSLYRAQLGEDSLELENVENDVSAIGTGGDRLYFVLGSGAHESWLAMTRGGGKIDRRYSKPIEGRVAYLSLAPDGEQAVLAVRPPGDGEVSMLRAFDLRKGQGREITRLEGAREILGTPQWTEQGIYFVAGKHKCICDVQKLYQVFINLLDNAIKYSDSGDRVDVEIEEDVSRLTVRIRDTGVGIPEEDLNQLFDRFYRVDKDRSRATGGSGLGLAISRQIVEMHGGRISVESEVDVGSVFEVTLPKAFLSRSASTAL